MRWMSQPRSELLWVEGFLGTDRSDRTTNFALDFEHFAKSSVNGTLRRYFCNNLVTGDNYCGSEMILQSFVFQLMLTNLSKFSWLLCRKFSLTQDRFRVAKNYANQLINLLEDCIEVVRSPRLYILLDDIVNRQPLEQHHQRPRRYRKDRRTLLLPEKASRSQQTSLQNSHYVSITTSAEPFLVHERSCIRIVSPQLCRQRSTYDRSTTTRISWEKLNVYAPFAYLSHTLPIHRKTEACRIPTTETLLTPPVDDDQIQQ